MTTSHAGKVELADRLEGLDRPTVWHEFSPLAMQHGAVNLGQGFPNWPAPQFVKDAACKAIENDVNQYARPQGHMRLVKAVAKSYTPWFGRELNPIDEVTVVTGAMQGMFCSNISILNPGDEVVVIEPHFDIYHPQAKAASSKAHSLPLREQVNPKTGETEFMLDLEELRSSLNDNTRVLVLNTPHNPTGKIFAKKELEDIANVLRDFPRVIVLADEVYEHIVFDGLKHERMANIEGMWDRTVTICSAGKTFSVTGWKIGWAIGPKHLIELVKAGNQAVQFAIATPLQDAIATSLEEAEKPQEGHANHYAALSANLQRKRDDLMKHLRDAGIKHVVPKGGYFIFANIKDIDFPEKYMQETTAAKPKMTRDWAFCRWLTIEKKITGIPMTSFYSKEHEALGENWVRFAYCKTDEEIEEAGKRFKNLRTSDPAL